MRLVIAAALCAATAAHAESGMDFLHRCHGADAPATCAAYERGFFAALNIAGVICPSPTVSDTQIQIVSERWLRVHVNHLDAPTPVILRNGMAHAWPCR